jgi:hypothetical protein
MFDFESDAKMHRTPTPKAFASPAHRDKNSADLQFPLRTADTTALIPTDLASFVLFSSQLISGLKYSIIARVEMLRRSIPLELCANLHT